MDLGDQIALGGVRVGDILTLEGGFARLFAKGSAHAGMAYYAQWKLTADDFGNSVMLPDGAILSRHRVFALGPDVTTPAFMPPGPGEPQQAGQESREAPFRKCTVPLLVSF